MMKITTQPSDTRAHLCGHDYARGWILAKQGGDPSVELLIHPLLANCISPLVSNGKARLLDAGCGDGARSQFLLANFPNLEVSAGDYNDELVQLARRNLPRGDIRQLDLGMPLPYADKSFDSIICVNVLMHLNDTQIINAATESARLLDCGGQALFVTVHADWAKAMGYAPGSNGPHWKLRHDIPRPNHQEHYPPTATLAQLFNVSGIETTVSHLIIPDRAVYLAAGYPDDTKLDRHCSHAGTTLFSVVEMKKR